MFLLYLSGMTNEDHCMGVKYIGYENGRLLNYGTKWCISKIV